MTENRIKGNLLFLQSESYYWSFSVGSFGDVSTVTAAAAFRGHLCHSSASHTDRPEDALKHPNRPRPRKQRDSEAAACEFSQGPGCGGFRSRWDRNQDVTGGGGPWRSIRLPVSLPCVPIGHWLAPLPVWTLWGDHHRQLLSAWRREVWTGVSGRSGSSSVWCSEAVTMRRVWVKIWALLVLLHLFLS